MRKVFSGAVVGILMSALAWMPVASAQDAWPTKPVKLIVPFSAGGNTDIVARVLADRMSALLGQQVVVENIPGSAGLIGANAVVSAPADGHTVLFASSNMTSFNLFVKDVQLDTLRDFAPVSLVSQYATIFLTTPEIPAKTLSEFFAYIARNPGRINFGAPSNSSIGLIMEMLKQQANLDIVIAPYSGEGPVMPALLSNEVHGMLASLIVAKPMIDAGSVVALGTSGLERMPEFPDLPTITEIIGKPLDGSFFTGFFVKAGTPDAIINELSKQVAAVLKEPVVMEKLSSLGQHPVGSTPVEFLSRLEREINQWREVATTAGIKPQ